MDFKKVFLLLKDELLVLKCLPYPLFSGSAGCAFELVILRSCFIPLFLFKLVFPFLSFVFFLLFCIGCCLLTFVDCR